MDEIDRIIERYQARTTDAMFDRYSYRDPANYMPEQELERAMIRWLAHVGWQDLSDRKLLEIGCGTGSALRTAIRLGFRPGNLAGNELMQNRFAEARTALPDAVRMYPGDATTLDLPDGAFDVVYQSMVFSSILDDDAQAALANTMWRLAKPGGGVLWYDFIYNNPSNADVRGLPERRIRALFPEAGIRSWSLTLAPPLSRAFCKIHPGCYTLLNALPILRTHLLCWISRPAAGPG